MIAETRQPLDQQQSKTSGEYLEGDLNAACFLAVRGFRFVGLRHDVGTRYLFRFHDPKREAEKAVMDYMGGEPACAKELFAALKDFKALLYNMRRKTDDSNTYYTR